MKDHAKEIRTRERCFILELMNDPANPEVSVARCRVEPKVTTELHRLSVREWYLVSQGSGLMEIGLGKPYRIGPGDTITIPAGTPQRVTNIGDEDLVIQCVCIPRFTEDSYEPLE